MLNRLISNYIFRIVVVIGLFVLSLVAICGLELEKSLNEIVAIGTLVNTCIVTYIGFRQHMTSLAQRKLEEDKHRADLFDRRFAVFQATQKVLSRVFRDGVCNYQDVHEYTPWIQQAYFLFDDTIYIYLQKIRDKLVGIASTSIQMQDVSKRRPELVQENHDLLVWLTDQLNIEQDGLFSKFRPYLRH